MKIIRKKSALRTSEFHKKKEFQKKVRMVLLSILLVLVLITPIVLLRSSRLQIAMVEVKGNNATKPESVEKIVRNDLEGKYGWIIPKSSAIFYPEEKIVNDLLNTFPRLASAQVSLKGAHTISVSLDERVPVAIYCKDVANMSDPAACYFMDAEGFIFSEAASFSGGIYPVFTSVPVLSKPTGQSFVSSETFNILKKFTADATRLELSPKYISKNADEYTMIISSGTKVIWNEGQDESMLVSNLDSFLHAPKTDGESELNNLVYIDLRFTNKVFYKFRD